MKALFLEFSVDGHRGGEIYHQRLHSFLLRHIDNLVPGTLPRLPESANTAWKRMQRAYDLCRRETPDLIISDISSASRNFRAVHHTLQRGGRLLLIAQSLPPSSLVRGRIKKLITTWCERYLILKADITVCNSRFTCRMLGDRVNDSQLRIIAPPGLEVAPTSRVETSDRWSRRPFRLLFVGECSRVKGLIHLIRALQKLKDKDILLHVVGGATQEPFYHQQVQNIISGAGLSDRVSFTGFADRAALNEKYRAASVCVVPSLVEGYGMVVAEALAFGLPTVASNAGALPELLTHEENGLLVNPADPDSLAEAINRLYEDDLLCRRLSQAAFESAKRLSTWDDFELVLNDKLIKSTLQKLFPA